MCHVLGTCLCTDSEQNSPVLDSADLWLRANSSCPGSLRTSAPPRTSQMRRTGLWRSRMSVCVLHRMHQSRDLNTCSWALTHCATHVVPMGTWEAQQIPIFSSSPGSTWESWYPVLMLTCACLAFAALCPGYLLQSYCHGPGPPHPRLTSHLKPAFRYLCKTQDPAWAPFNKPLLGWTVRC